MPGYNADKGVPMQAEFWHQRWQAGEIGKQVKLAFTSMTTMTI